VRPLIGLSVALGANGNDHSATFLAAVEWWRTQRATTASRFRFDLQSDDATHQGGHRAARYFADRGAACVVGHFSSAAAFQAVETYTRTPIPAILPAATDDRLSMAAMTPRGPIALRLSADNDRLMRRLAEHLHDRGIHSPTLHVESTLYAQRLQVLLHQHTARLGVRLNGTPRAEPSNVTCILGKERYVRETLAILTTHKAPPPEVIVLDDAVTEGITRHLPPSAPTRVTGLVARTHLPIPRDLRATAPPAAHRPFFWETAAALEVAIIIAGTSGAPLAPARYDTCFGPLTFTPHGLLVGADVTVTTLQLPVQ